MRPAVSGRDFGDARCFGRNGLPWKRLGEREILAFEPVVMGPRCVPRLVGEASQAQFVQGFEGAVFLLSFFRLFSDGRSGYGNWGLTAPPW